MKTFKILTISLLIFISGCEKDDQSGSCNCSYLNLAYSSGNPTDTKVIINDSVVKLNQIFASYYSLQPSMNQNVLRLEMTDTTQFYCHLRFELFTPPFLAEAFFIEETFFIDSMWVDHNGTREDFFDADVQFTWHDVNYSNRLFNGKASLVLNKKLIGKLDTSIFYPEQTIVFEIR